MTDQIQNPAGKKYNKFIILLSVAIPLVVAVLFGVKIDLDLPVFLPPIYASINALTAFILLLAVWAIKNNKRTLHENLMKTAIFLSVVFLVLYVLYHMTSNSTPFGGTGMVKLVYYFILISHILLSVVVIPFVLITFVRAITNDIASHKKIARITFPLWLYVAVTGVIVYVMIAPYYAI
jgi:putative membrane protein